MAANMTNNNMVVGLDIGTSKIVAIVGHRTADGEVEIVGIGSHPSRGLKKGVVINIESTVLSIQRAIEEAELMAGCNIHSVYVGIAGSHIRSMNSDGVATTSNREVTEDDIDRVVSSAREKATSRITTDQEIIHVIPQEYTIDLHEGIKEPLGMSGREIKVQVHLVTAAVNAIQNIVKCVGRCGLEVDGVILEQLASSYAVLNEDERELGVCLVDIGGGTTDIAIFTEGAIKHTSVIPIAGDQVTNDIAMALRTPTQNAEEIKIKYACALTQLASEEHVFQVPSVGERPPQELSRQRLAEVVEPRYEELFTLVLDEIRRSGFEDLIPAGIVLTGGTSKMEGVVQLAEEIFHMQVRIASPSNIKGLSDVVGNPIYSTGVGLLVYGLENTGATSNSRAAYIEEQSPGQADDMSIVEKVRGWFKGNF
ncbi:cell division protein FtsA [Oceanospirillum linum]|uniref:Cell division protein FtsA n=1 Tax=Oceanospirillum linum TaxID=966 RepID=A0A1T1HF20_OCELI|nr:cell division protein FtsA [Oceanospirillum linum]OOV88423.1 cell division protein FtsA [Oceanospirillum linum]SEF55744.1 cell division protein FtsA [Oleiphilus messinensis]SMP05322.1 cell division protein FtsA [Oceanospirillum linum]